MTTVALQKATWVEKRIGDVCDVGDGVHAKIKRQDSGVRYLTSKNFKDGGLDLSKVDYIAEEDFNKHFREHSKALTKPASDDVVFSIIGSLGEPYLVKTQDRFGISSSVAILRPDKSVLDPTYLYYWVKGHIFQNALYGIKGGVAQGYVSLEMIRSLPLRHPSLPIQRRITSALSAYDGLIENNSRRIEVLQGMARTIYREWFVNFRFPGHEKAEMVDSEAGVIPRRWEVKTLGDVVELAYGKALKQDDRIPGRVPVYGSSGIVGYHNENMVNGPGIIVGRKGNVGSVHWSDYGFFPIDTVYYVRTDVNLRYAYYNLQDQNFINNDAAVPGLNRGQAYSLPFLVPDLDILEQFRQIVNPMFHQLRVLKKKNDNLRRTRDLLLPKLISGEVDVTQGSIDLEVTQRSLA